MALLSALKLYVTPREENFTGELAIQEIDDVGLTVQSLIPSSGMNIYWSACGADVTTLNPVDENLTNGVDVEYWFSYKHTYVPFISSIHTDIAGGYNILSSIYSIRLNNLPNFYPQVSSNLSGIAKSSCIVPVCQVLHNESFM